MQWRGTSVQDKINFLMQVEQFKDLQQARLRKLAESAECREWNARDVLFRQNEPVEHIYFVVKGQLALYQQFDTRVPYPKLSMIRIKHECNLRSDNHCHTQTRLFQRLNKLVDDRIDTSRSQKKLVRKANTFQAVGFQAIADPNKGANWKYEAVALSHTRCLLIEKDVLDRLLQEEAEPTLLTQCQPRRLSFAAFMDGHIRQLDSMLHRRRSSVSVRHKHTPSKSLHFLSKLYQKPR